MFHFSSSSSLKNAINFQTCVIFFANIILLVKLTFKFKFSFLRIDQIGEQRESKTVRDDPYLQSSCPTYGC